MPEVFWRKDMFLKNMDSCFNHAPRHERRTQTREDQSGGCNILKGKIYIFKQKPECCKAVDRYHKYTF